MGAPVVMASYPVAGHMPAQHMAAYPQVVMPVASDEYDAGRAAASLADGVNNMVLNPGQAHGGGMGSPTRGYYGQGNYSYYPVQHGAAGPPGPPGPPPGRGGGRMHMNMQHMNGRGRGSAGLGPGAGPGMGVDGVIPQGGERRQQRRRKVQKGLEDNVRRTVYISYIDQQVTEESLATLFQECGTVMDCRICGDPNSYMRFAFIEFQEEESAQKALGMTGRILGNSPLRVLASRTAIVPVNKELMPRSHNELERCSRTVYVANIDKKVDREDVRRFFEQLCGPVAKIRLLGDFQHSTRIAFIEFMTAEGAMAALNCSGALLGSLPLRVSPSKTPVRGDKEGDREPPLPGAAPPAAPPSQPRTSQSSGSAAGEHLVMPGTPGSTAGAGSSINGIRGPEEGQPELGSNAADGLEAAAQPLGAGPLQAPQ